MILALRHNSCTILGAFKTGRILFGRQINRYQSTVSIGDVKKELFEVKHPEYVPVNYCKYFQFIFCMKNI